MPDNDLGRLPESSRTPEPPASSTSTSRARFVGHLQTLSAAEQVRALTPPRPFVLGTEPVQLSTDRGSTQPPPDTPSVGRAVQFDGVTKRDVAKLFHGLVEVSDLEGRRRRYTGKGIVGLPAFAANEATLEVTDEGGKLTASATVAASGSEAVKSGRAELTASSESSKLQMDGTVKISRAFWPPLGPMNVPIEGTSKGSGDGVELISDPTVKEGQIGILEGLTYNLRTDTFNAPKFDLDLVEAGLLHLPGIANADASALRLENNYAYGEISLESQPFNLPNAETPVLSGTVLGKLSVVKSAVSAATVGGPATFVAPGLDPIHVNWTADFAGGSLRDLTLQQIDAQLASPLALGRHVLINQLTVHYDHSAGAFTVDGAGQLTDVPYLQDTEVLADYDSETKTLVVRVPRADLDLPDLAHTRPRGHVEKLVLTSTEEGFDSKGKGHFAVDLPILGECTADLKLRKNRIAKAKLKCRSQVAIPEGTPLLEGPAKGDIEFEDGQFKEAEVKANLALNIPGREAETDLVKLSGQLESNGKIDVDVKVKTNVDLGDHIHLVGAELKYRGGRGKKGDVFKGKLKYKIVKVGKLDLPELESDFSTDGGVKDDTGKQAKGLESDGYDFDFDYGFSFPKGFYLQGIARVGKGDMAASGRFYANTVDLLTGNAIDIDVAAVGIPLYQGTQIVRPVFHYDTRQIPLVAFPPYGGLFAEFGADLDFKFTVNPFFADLRGVLTGFDLSQLKPSRADFDATLMGTLQAQLLGGPKLGLGAWFVTPGLLTASGGLKMPVDTVLSAIPKQKLALQYADGAFSAKAESSLPLYFGIATKLVPYYHLTGLGGILEYGPKTLNPLAEIQLLKTRRIADLRFDFGQLAKSEPVPAESMLDFSVTETGTATEPIETSGEAELVSQPTTTSPSSEPAGDAEMFDDASVFDVLLESLKEYPFYGTLESALALFRAVGESISSVGEKIASAIEWLNSTLSWMGVDLVSVAKSLLKVPALLGGKRSKKDLVKALWTAFGMDEPETEEGTDSDGGTQFTLRLSGTRITILKSSGNDALVVDNPLGPSDLALDEHQEHLTFGDGGIEGGHLTGSITMGEWGTVSGLELGVAKGAVDPVLKDASYAGKASEVFGVGSTVSGTFTTQAANITKVELNQGTDETVLPGSVGGVELKSTGMKITFMQRTPNAWSVVDGNTVSLPFTGGQFTAQLVEKEWGPDGKLNAKGVIYFRLDMLGQAMANLEIVKDKLANLTFAFESNEFAFPPTQPVASAKVQGQLAIEGGELAGGKLEIFASADIGSGLMPMGKGVVELAQVGSEWKPGLTVDAESSFLDQIVLFDMLRIKRLHLEKPAEGPFVTEGDLRLAIPALGTFDGTLRYDSGEGFSATFDGDIERSGITGRVTGSYGRAGLTFDGNAVITGVPGMKPIETRLAFGRNRILFKVSGDTDLINTSLGPVDLHGGIDELVYHLDAGKFTGGGHVKGTLPILGEVAGALSLDDQEADPTDREVTNPPAKKLVVKEASLKFANKTLAVPTKAPVIVGSLTTGDEGLVYKGTSDSERGVNGRITGEALVFTVPGISGENTLNFEVRFENNRPSGFIRLAKEGKGAGYFWLKSVGAELESDGSYAGDVGLGLNIKGQDIDIEGKLTNEAYTVTAKNIAFGTREDTLSCQSLEVGYDSATGLFFDGDLHLNAMGLHTDLSVDYGANEAGEKRLNAQAEVEKIKLMSGSKTTKSLLDLKAIQIPVMALWPVPISVWAHLGANAEISYGMDDLFLSGKLSAYGVDLANRSFDAILLEPQLEGGYRADLVGGPYVGVSAALLHPWAAHVTGDAKLAIGAHAALEPKLKTAIRYGGDGSLQGAARLKMPLVMSVTASPQLTLNAGVMGDLWKIPEQKFTLAEFELMRPKKIFEAVLDFGDLDALKGKSADDLAPDAEDGLEDAAVPEGQELAQKPTEPTQEADTEASAPEGDLASSSGPFDMGMLFSGLVEKAGVVRDKLYEIWETLSNLGAAIAEKAKAAGAAVLTTLEDTTRWVVSFFAGDEEAAQEAVAKADSLLEVENLGGYSPELRAKLEELNRDLERRSGTSEGAWKEGVEAALAMKDFVDRDLDKMQKGDHPVERLLYVRFTTVVRNRAMGPVLAALTPPQRFDASGYDYVSRNGVEVADIFKSTSKETLNAFFKTARVKELHVIKDYFVKVEGLSYPQVFSLFERITRTYWGTIFGIGGHGDEVRQRLNEAGVMLTSEAVSPRIKQAIRLDQATIRATGDQAHERRMLITLLEDLQRLGLNEILQHFIPTDEAMSAYDFAKRTGIKVAPLLKSARDEPRKLWLKGSAEALQHVRQYLIDMEGFSYPDTFAYFKKIARGDEGHSVRRAFQKAGLWLDTAGVKPALYQVLFNERRLAGNDDRPEERRAFVGFAEVLHDFGKVEYLQRMLPRSSSDSGFELWMRNRVSLRKMTADHAWKDEWREARRHQVVALRDYLLVVEGLSYPQIFTLFESRIPGEWKQDKNGHNVWDEYTSVRRLFTQARAIETLESVGDVLDQGLALDRKAIREGQQPELRQCLIRFIALMKRYRAKDVLTELMPHRPGESVMGHICDRSVTVTRELPYGGGSIRELWKVGDANDLQQVKEYLTVVEGKSSSWVNNYFETKITRSFSNAPLVGWQSTVRQNLAKAGIRRR